MGYLKESLGLNEGKMPEPANSKCEKQSGGKASAIIELHKQLHLSHHPTMRVQNSHTGN